jgi:hypothetical protein
LIRPTLDLAVAFNRVSREADEWFDEPDDLEPCSFTLRDRVSIMEQDRATVSHDLGGGQCVLAPMFARRAAPYVRLVVPRTRRTNDCLHGGS